MKYTVCILVCITLLSGADDVPGRGFTVGDLDRSKLQDTLIYVYEDVAVVDINATVKLVLIFPDAHIKRKVAHNSRLVEISLRQMLSRAEKREDFSIHHYTRQLRREIKDFTEIDRDFHVEIHLPTVN
ncbi:MAG: hypothetical protein ACQEQ4_05570 [Fibrobacterota bacterium]